MPVRWKAIPDMPGYEASTGGRVRSNRRGRYRILLSTPDRGGYHRVAVYLGGRRRYFAVHRLVLLTFVGPCPAGQEGRHLDDDADNNRLTNLAWGTRLDNKKDQRKNGGLPVGSGNGRAKLTEDKVRAMRQRRRDTGESYPKLAKRFGVSCPTAFHACVGNTWKHLKEDV